MYKFTSNITLGKPLRSATTDDVKNEPMFFNSNLEFALKNGGTLTKNFLTALIKETKRLDWIIDSKSVMLMKGWYPCIPGFHHDDVPRSTENGQPIYKNPPYRSVHAMAIQGDPICCTEFALGTGSFTVPSKNDIAYKVWHPEVVEKIESGELVSFSAPMERIIYFDDRSWHQGVPSTGPGWRWFIRASAGTDRILTATNEIRNQVQVYLENPMEGW
jgi:hypothetical protein